MQGRVTLSSDPLIDFLDFSQAIADAVCPTGEKGLDGLACVIGKLVTYQVPIPQSGGFMESWQSVLVSSDGRTLNELSSSGQPIMGDGGASERPVQESPPPQIGEVTVQFDLSDADRRAFARVLEQLKHWPLRYPMSEKERAGFMDAYLGLPNRPMWVPELVTEAIITTIMVRPSFESKLRPSWRVTKRLRRIWACPYIFRPANSRPFSTVLFWSRSSWMHSTMHIRMSNKVSFPGLKK